ncbi:4'-phosphopantetheinyl transferase family protein [Streptomyces sp. col6]|uniref:4'-phosphopantetheinyl transferase family protein n=1 Tax=Streptomyces sp. col6 TaxID=2478958 RepID=UPI00174673B3|nr:4'-phosphopantetheinyl transferase superfamily protein [Streptomyces sp. col6]
MTGPASSLLAPLLPAYVGVAEAEPAHESIGLLDAAELRVVEDAIPSRQREFAVGRQLAHRLMAELGHARESLLPHPDRSPRWPEGVVGSITHCATRVAVAVGRSADVRGLGIDVEPCVPLPADLDPLILNAEEARRREAGNDEERRLRSRWVFSAKEATYKAMYPLTRRVLEFAHLEVFWSPDGFTSELRCAAPPFPKGALFSGRSSTAGGYITHAVVIGHDH